MANNKSDSINMAEILRNYISHWYLFAISLVCCLGLGFFVAHVHKDKYAVHANVIVEGETKSPLAGMTDLSSMLSGGSSGVLDEIYVISSHSLYRDVAKSLGLNKTHYLRLGIMNNLLLYPEWPIDVYASEEMLDTLSRTFSFKVSVDEKGLADIVVRGPEHYKEKYKDVKLPYNVATPYGEFTVDRTKYFPKGESLTAKVNITGYHKAAEELSKDITSSIPTKHSNVVELNYITKNPGLGEAILDAVIQKYNERGIRETNAQAVKTAQFLEERIRLLASDLSESEASMQTFKENQGIVDVTHEAAYQTQKRAAVEAELIAAETQLDVIRLMRDFVSKPENKYELIPVSVDSESLQSAIGGFNGMIMKRNELLRTVKPENIAVQRLNERIDAQRSNIISTVNQLYDNTAVTVRDLRNQMSSTGSRLGNIPAQERAVIDMRRQLQIKQQLFLFLRQRQEENAMLMANALPKGTLVDAAYTSTEPVGMGKKAILFIAFIMGLCLPPAYLYTRKLIRNRFESREELERMSDVPMLGEMCTDRSGRNLVVSPSDTSSATELFRLMRANLLFVLNDESDKVVLVTSSVSGEGKSFIASNLAATLSLLSKKVLLVGMDIRAPKLSSYLGVRPAPGLTQYLAGNDVSLSQIIQKSPVEGLTDLDIIVAGPIPPNPAELLASKRVDQAFAELRGMYDYIIVDSAPVGLVSDTFSLDRIADATVYVCRVNYTRNSDIRELNRLYEQGKLKKLSLVVNGTKSHKSYGYRAADGRKS